MAIPATQVPGSWHWSGAAHMTVVAGVQTPVWQVSPEVHKLLSSQTVPLVVGGSLTALTVIVKV